MTDFTLSDGRRVHLIGDPHLGRKFENGVPQHRRGERELEQSLHFIEELQADADIVVMVGDLFENPYVTDAVIVAAARAVLRVAETNPDVLFFMQAGNHDVPRNKAVVGAWHAFREMTQDRFDNLIIVTTPVVRDGIALFPWEWGVTAKEQVDAVSGSAEAAIGHWDTVAFEGKDDHLVPVAALRRAFGDISVWTGHVHVPGTIEIDGWPVVKTGSMEPYTHGEDPEGKLYLTLPLAEAIERDDLRGKYVRVILAPGEDMPEIDCLGLTHLRSAEEATAEETTMSLDDLDWNRILDERIRTLDPVVQTFIKERIVIHAPEEQR